MTKTEVEKAGKMAGKMKEQSMGKLIEMLEMGNELGNALTGLLIVPETNWRGIGVSAIGMAKAMAALKTIAWESKVDIDKVYEGVFDFWMNKFCLIADDLKEAGECLNQHD